MTLISSISGIRGTIGGKEGENLTPNDILKFTRAYAQYIINNSSVHNPTVIIGRDSRISGEMLESIITGTLSALGIHSICLGLTTTPTTELAVKHYKAQGGIIITASHNPANWNALKLLNNNGEFLTAEEGKEIEKFIETPIAEYAPYFALGSIKHVSNFVNEHIEKILNLPLVDIEAIKKANFNIVADVINSAGAVSVEPLLRALGVEKIKILNKEANGQFAHNPEPLAENLKDLSKAVIDEKADLGIAVDPDVDRLALMMENGVLFGEEYTLVAVADYVLKHTPGNTVSNLSSTAALKVITEQHGQNYSSSAVGEVNVVAKMKETNAIIGGEGNGGVIYPESHYGRDALVGIALFLSHLAHKKLKMTELKASYPSFFISKHKINTEKNNIDFPKLAEKLEKHFKECEASSIDGLKLIFKNNNWVHIRTSNTEPIIRIYAESKTEAEADALAFLVISTIKNIISI